MVEIDLITHPHSSAKFAEVWVRRKWVQRFESSFDRTFAKPSVVAGSSECNPGAARNLVMICEELPNIDQGVIRPTVSDGPPRGVSVKSEAMRRFVRSIDGLNGTFARQGRTQGIDEHLVTCELTIACCVVDIRDARLYCLDFLDLGWGQIVYRQVCQLSSELIANADSWIYSEVRPSRCTYG